MIFRIRDYKIWIPRQILRQNTGLTFLWGHLRSHLRGHVIIFRLRIYQIRIPRQILRRNTGLTFLLAQS